jgi:hypothetical protein
MALPRPEDETRLGSGKGNRAVGDDGRAFDFARIRMQARRNVHGDDEAPRPAPIDGGDHFGEPAFHRSVRARPQQRVDNNRVFGKRDRPAPASYMEIARSASPALEVCRGVAFHVASIADEESFHACPGLQKLPRNDEAIAAIVPLTAQNDYRAPVQVREARLNHLRDTFSRVLHEGKARNPVLGRRQTVDLSHFRSGQDFHE